jgi:hypothetical protein
LKSIPASWSAGNHPNTRTDDPDTIIFHGNSLA